MAVVALIVTSVVLLAQLIAAKTHSGIRRSGFFGGLIFLTAAVIMFVYASYLSWQQYQVWHNNELSKLFLPPYQSFDYFIFYVRTRFFNSYLLSLAVGLAGLLAAQFLNKRYQERFFETAEPYLLGTALFLSGHPGWILYAVIAGFLSVLVSSFHFWRVRETRRLSFYYLWLPAALFTIMISMWLSALPWLQTLKF